MFHLGLIKQFLRDVDWGDIDYLLVDTPPGTSDEHLSIVQYLKTVSITGAIVVTTPQVSVNDDDDDIYWLVVSLMVDNYMVVKVLDGELG